MASSASPPREWTSEVTAEKEEDVYNKLSDLEYFAVDSEGIHLSREGPLTLLQIAAPDGYVYLFDVLSRRECLDRHGRLGALLQSEKIVKVMHGAKTDAEALWAQFRLQLRNVHDTQVAHQMLQKSVGQQFPPRCRLNELIQIHCPEKKHLPGDKDLVVRKMTKVNGEYWAVRPLTQEMIEYAESDVRALVPEMYTKQKQQLAARDLAERFKLHMDRVLESGRDSKVDSILRDNEQAEMEVLLTHFHTHGYLLDLRFQDIKDENVRQALRYIRLNELTQHAPNSVRLLKIQEMEIQIDDIEQGMSREGQDYDAYNVIRRLHAVVSSMDESHDLKARGKQVLKRVQAILLQDIQNKYTIHTPVEHLAIHERIILQEVFEDNLNKDYLPGLLYKLCQDVMYHVLQAIEYQVWNCPQLHNRKKRALKACKEAVGTDLKQLAERIEEQQKILWSGMLSPEQASRASSVLSSPYSPLKLARDARDTPPQNRSGQNVQDSPPQNRSGQNIPNLPPQHRPAQNVPNLPPQYRPAQNVPNLPPQYRPAQNVPNLPPQYRPAQNVPNLPPQYRPAQNVPNLPQHRPAQNVPNLPPPNVLVPNNPNIHQQNIPGQNVPPQNLFISNMPLLYRPFWVHPPPAYPTALALQAMRHVPAAVAPATVTQGRSKARSSLSTPTGEPPPWAEREGTPLTSSQ